MAAFPKLRVSIESDLSLGFTDWHEMKIRCFKETFDLGACRWDRKHVTVTESRDSFPNR